MEIDILKEKCINQGYVPKKCTMSGMMCFALVLSQGDPCRGCNENRSVCNGRPREIKNQKDAELNASP